jgi:hypothetical protein
MILDIVQGFPTPPPPNAYEILVGMSERKRSVWDLDEDGRREAPTAVRIVGRDQWQALVRTILQFRVPKMVGNLLTS